MLLKAVLKHTPLRRRTTTNKWVYLLLLYSILKELKQLKDSCLFLYYLLHSHMTVATTVYRSYGTKGEVIVVRIAIGIEQVVVGVRIAFIHSPWAKVSIIRVRIDPTRSQPLQQCPNLIGF